MAHGLFKRVFSRSLIHILLRVRVTYSYYQVMAYLKPHTLGKLPGIADSCNSRSWSLESNGRFILPVREQTCRFNSTSKPGKNWTKFGAEQNGSWVKKNIKERGEEMKLISWVMDLNVHYLSYLRQNRGGVIVPYGLSSPTLPSH